MAPGANGVRCLFNKTPFNLCLNLLCKWFLNAFCLKNTCIVSSVELDYAGIALHNICNFQDGHHVRLGNHSGINLCRVIIYILASSWGRGSRNGQSQLEKERQGTRGRSCPTR